MRRHHREYGLLILFAVAMVLVPTAGIAGGDDIADHPYCPICGMDRHQFAHSRMLIHYTDGSQFGACSLHCAALELAYHPGKIPSRIEVADLNTHRLIDAETATWVIGGKKMGVMTANAKWAFANPADAKRFVAEQGGEIADFEAAMSAAYAGMYQDTRMIRQKRKHMQQMKSGQMEHGKHDSE
jgi:copper chaperone NosL